MASTAAPDRPTSFGVAFAVLPQPQREAIRAVHAWSRSVDDSVDEESDSVRARERLLHWRREVAACYEGEPEEPASRALLPHLRRYGVPREHLEELVNGVEMDLTHTRYPSFSELKCYCHRVASVVGLVCLRIFGEEEERGRAYAENLGVALQLTNILRDLGRDHARGRIYLPADEREAHGYTEEALARHERSERFHALMRFQAARVRGLFAAAEQEARRLDPRRIVAAEIMGRVYRRLMDRIEASGFDVFARKIQVPRSERIWIAGRAILAARIPR
jgi:15-cis-phytoene synthase